MSVQYKWGQVLTCQLNDCGFVIRNARTSIDEVEKLHKHLTNNHGPHTMAAAFKLLEQWRASDRARAVPK